MKRVFLLLFAVFVILITSTFVNADPVIFNTGVNSSAAVLPDNSVDPHWTISPGNPALVQSSISATPPSDTLSAWIRPNSNFGPGSYLAETTFTWPRVETITIDGQWAAMVSGLDVRINGVSTGATTANPGNTAWTPLHVTGTSIAGTNTLDFVPFQQSGVGPALRVEITSVTPEPTGAAIIASLAAGALLRRRRAIS